MKRTQRLYSKSVARKKASTLHQEQQQQQQQHAHTLTDKTAAPGQSKPCAHKRFYFSLLFPFPRSFIPFPFCFLLFFFTSSFPLPLSLFFSTLYHFLIRIMSHDVGFSTRQTLSSPLAHSLELPPIIQDTSMYRYAMLMGCVCVCVCVESVIVEN